VKENHLLFLLLKALLRNPNFFFPRCTAILSSFLFIRWRKEKERNEDEEVVIRLSLIGGLEGASHQSS